MKIPLAERFHSIQGEGYWTGVPMHFIRLPGCTVGKPWSDNKLIPDSAPTLPGVEKAKAWQCTSFSGQKFWCDTDFKKYLEEEGSTILADTWESHLCLTGGEPLMHRSVVDYFRTQCQIRNIRLHIETSGTIDFWWEADLHSSTTSCYGMIIDDSRDTWITVSPKQDWSPYMIHYANELKLLIDKDFDEKSLDSSFFNHSRVYLSPINNVGTGGLYHPDSGEARDRCLEMLRLHPTWRISIQTHKYLNVR